MNDIAFVTWTNTECEDVFPLYFGQFDKYCNDYKSYVIINENSPEIPERHIQLVNDENDSFYKRLVSCLEQIEEKYVIYMQEDHILYDDLQKEKLTELFEYMKGFRL